MKILYFSRDYTPHDHRFLASLAQTEHRVFYLRLEHGAEQIEDRPIPARIEQIQWAGGRQMFRWRNLPRYLGGLKRVIRSIQPDLIHAGPIQDVGFLATLSGFHPTLIMSWGFDMMQDVHRNRGYEWITKHVLRNADYYVSDAVVTREKAIAYGMHPDRTTVFPWGVDLSHFSPRPERKPGKVTFTLLCNRKWEPLYGVDVLARAFVKVAHQKKEIRLMLLSLGSQGSRIRQILNSGGVMEQVNFGGWVSHADLPRCYHQADLYVSPSHVDGSSVSLMEALACGLPVLVSDIPANREWVTEGVNGWLFPDGDVDALAARIIWAFEHPKECREMGRSARAVAEARANWNENFRQLMQAYELAIRTKEN